jgi:mannitol-1-phosphate/altronate dehydrogenase
MAETLSRRAKQGGKDPRPFLGIREIFGDDLPNSSIFVAQVSEALRSLYDRGAKATLNQYVQATNTSTNR